MSLGGVPTARAVANPWTSPAECGPEDTPETGIQGDIPRADQLSERARQGYNCGLVVVGHNPLPAKDMAWSGDCAYVQSDEGVAVLDVSDPSDPQAVGLLEGTGDGSENLHAVTTPKRALLVATGTSNAATGETPVDVFDVRACTTPRHVGTIAFPNSVHNLELTPQGDRVFGSMPLQVADIHDLAHPETWSVRDFQCELAAQVHPVQQATSAPCETWRDNGVPRYMSVPVVVAHEFEFNRDGTRMYLAGQMPKEAPGEHMLHVVDISAWPYKVISSIPGEGHGIRRATIDGEDFLLHSDETAIIAAYGGVAVGAVESTGVPAPVGVANPSSTGANGCVPDDATPAAGAAEAFLTDISDETQPTTVSELELAINDPANCAAQVQSGVRSTVHYNEVDDPDDTHFAMLPMGNAGLRIFDVRDPAAPSEVAYFAPGQVVRSDGTTALDAAGNHTRYDASSGHIWLTTRLGGFWVLEIEPQVRAQLGLKGSGGQYPKGRPARPAELAFEARPASFSTTGRPDLVYYCGV